MEGATKNPISRSTLSEQIRQYLEDQIHTGVLTPGQAIVEAQIAQELQVSRAPVREATRLLNAQGLVQLVPHKGAVVVKLSREELHHIYEVRLALEQLVMRRAVPTLTLSDLQRLMELHQKMRADVAAHDVRSYFEANIAFHAEFMKRSGNPKLEELLGQIQLQTQRYRKRSLLLPQRLDASLLEHQRILEAAIKRDVEGAVQAMTEHIRTAECALDDYLQSE